MYTKLYTIFLVLVTSITLTGCGQKQSITDNFVEYDSTDFIEENDLSDRIPVFSVKYPPEWEVGWFADSGAIALLISSGDVDAAWSMQDTSGAFMMIMPSRYDSEEYNGKKLSDLELTDLLYGTGWGNILKEPSTITINGQDAARVEYNYNERVTIEVVIVREEWVLNVMGFLPPENETEFRSLLEGMIGTIEIK